MLTTDFHLEALTSRRLLERYLRGELPSVQDVRFEAFNGVREAHGRLPDYALKQPRELAFGEAKCLPQLLAACLGDLSARLLEFDGRVPRVRHGQMEAWQNCVTRVSPTWLIVSALLAHMKESGHTDEAQAQTRLLRTLSHSTLPSPRNMALEDLADSHGLYDLHIHLNGTSEADVFWQHAVNNPRDFAGALNKARRESEDLQEFYASHGMENHHDILFRLRLASWLRRQLVDILFPFQCHAAPPGETRPAASSGPAPRDLREACAGVQSFMRLDETRDRERRHPVADRMPLLQSASFLAGEGVMLLKAFQALDGQTSSVLAHILHGYMLLQSAFCRLVVQQQTQAGFDQFQKITFTDLRSVYEDKQYEDRFRQLTGMYGNGVKYLEGRFSPKDSPLENRRLFEKIIRGYKLAYGGTPESRPNDDQPPGAERQASGGPVQGPFPCPDCPGHKDRRLYEKPSFLKAYAQTHNAPALGLVAHFIKKKDSEKSTVRHYSLRKDNEKRARALVGALEQDARYCSFFCGVDAASNELHAPPEVYAPLFRYLRDWGGCRVTYHVGEDFRHLVSGLRAVWEALTFLDMREGDRIGHGTALGIRPEIWRRSLKNAICLPQGEWLDNLVWLYRISGHLSCAGRFPAWMEHRIRELFFAVYNQDCPDLFILEKAWEFRGLDPLAGLSGSRETPCVFRRSEMEKIQEAERKSPRAMKLLQGYHDPLTRKNYDAVMEVPQTDLIENDLLKALQDAVVTEVNRRGVLVEVMPTSNVRISFYRDFAEHHCLGWLDPDFNRPAPKFCIATDDPGIFSTNLKNEFCLIGEVLEKNYPASSQRQVFESLILNARSYRFLPNC